ncbi:hypothetical protein Q5P01_006075 [Channa striata]|uniref:C2H2-type domain-containing protein n=1 Tax=Channa striata TaxID=64152 RepID=A0AA88T0G3_CHASR|nr:hypothetical protein Q5P01_006075 [Channa striata]
MAASSTVLQNNDGGNGGSKRTACPLYGCKRVYTDMSALDSHVRDHEIPAQSLPGKVLLCSTVGCSSSFPSMQKLMEHMRHHHKPNIFFLCESCRTKLRSYRGLLTHLHTCSKVPRGKTKPSEPIVALPSAATNTNITLMAMDQEPPHLDPQQTSHSPNPDGSFPTVLQSDSAAPPLLGPPSLSHPESSPPQLAPQQPTEAAPPPPLRTRGSNLPPALNLDGPTAPPNPTDVQDQKQTQSLSPERVYPGLGSAPHSPLAAVWKKNQGAACSRRILWEHTKGRYTCVQCGQTATNRKEMTQHINSYHSGNKPTEDTGSSASFT